MSTLPIPKSSALRRVLCSAAALIATLALAAVPAPAAGAQTGERCFPETGQCISGRIREYWEQNGGLPVFGYPLGPQQAEQIEGKEYQAQLFQRNRLELHPENERPYDVLIGRMGVTALEQQGRDWFSFPKADPNGITGGCRYFAETGHNVCNEFFTAYFNYGLDLGQPGTSYAESLALFGLPISEVMTETIEGKEYQAQWFERARFELHPENQEPYNVLFGLLGAETSMGMSQAGAQNRYVLPGDQVFPEGVAYQLSTGAVYVSSTSDGTIFRANARSSVASPYLKGGADDRTAATGLKVDDARNRLFVSGAATGQMWVYDTTSGNLIAHAGTARTATFINDVTVVPNGDAFFTDSQSPVIYRLPLGATGTVPAEEWLDFTGTALVYQQGFNVNGIASTTDGLYLIVVQSNTGKLFRINTTTRQVSEISLGGETVTNGDGILLDGSVLYVVRNQNGEIVKIQMSENLSSGMIVSRTSDPSFAYPTTIARAGDRLLVVNSQFDKRGDGLTPSLPFTVVSVPIP